MLEINKQKMSYSQQSGKVPVYVTDDDGNIEYSSYTDSDGNVIYYLDEDGNKIPKTTGEYTTGYEKPVVFYSSISNKLSEALIKEFGVDNSTNFVQIVEDKGKLPLYVNSVMSRFHTFLHLYDSVVMRIYFFSHLRYFIFDLGRVV